jgi:hypothetical protein
MNFRVRFPFLAEGVEMTKRGPFDFAQDMLCAFAQIFRVLVAAPPR